MASDQARITERPTCIEGTAANGLKSASPGCESSGSLPVTALEGSRPSSGRKRGGAVGKSA